MRTTARLNRTDLSSGETHRVLLASVFTPMLMAAASVHVIGAEHPHEKHSSETAPTSAASARTNTGTNLALLLQEADYWATPRSADTRNRALVPVPNWNQPVRLDSHLRHGRV